MSSARPRMLALLFGALWLNAAVAQNSETEALALIKTYIERHNAHDLPGVMELYAADAVFQLNMQRPAVQGKEAIEQLERFDVAARSTLYPVHIEAQPQEGRWRIDLGGVIEHSAVFEAAGATIVLAEPVQEGFLLKDGKIQAIRQPELPEACRTLIAGAFRETALWLGETRDARRDGLVAGGMLRLTPETIPAVVEAVRAWRAQAPPPEPALVSACAGFDP